MDIDKSNWDSEVTNSKVPVIVDFWAEWCAPCKAIAPVLDEIEKNSGGKAKVVKVNIEKETELVAKYRIRSVPTVLVLEGGEVKGRVMGFNANTKVEIQKIIEG